MNDPQPTTTRRAGLGAACASLGAGARSLVLPLAFTAAALPPVCAAHAADLTDPDAAVESGREALGDHWALPWYDAAADDYRPLDLTPQEDWNLEWLDGLFDFFSGWELGWLLKLLAWTAAAALVAWIVYLLIKAYQEAELRSAQVADDADDARNHIERIEALPVAVERKVTDLLAEARRLHAAGEWALAIVYLFSHQLVVLDKSGLIRLVKGKTNRQYLRELRRSTAGRPRLASIFSETTLLFEESFFGAHTPTAEKIDARFTEAGEFENQAALAAAEGEP